MKSGAGYPDEVDEQGAPLPDAPSEKHLTGQGWIHNAFALSLGLCAVGLTAAFIFYWVNGHTVRSLVIGFIVQLLGAAITAALGWLHWRLHHPGRGRRGH